MTLAMMMGALGAPAVGGIDPPSDILSVSEYRAHYDYALDIVESANLISEVGDQTPNGYDAVQATGGQMPLWDGIGKATFDGGDVLTSTGIVIDEGEIVHVWCVGTFTTDTPPNGDTVYALEGGSQIGDMALRANGSNDIEMRAVLDGGGGSDATLTMTTTTAIDSANLKLWQHLCGDEKQEFRENEDTVQTQTSVAGKSGIGDDIDALYMGSLRTTNNTAPCEIHELLIAVGVLTAQQIADIRTYFLDKYTVA